MVVCEEKKRVGGTRERIILFIILLDNLYYFIGKIDKVVLKDVK